MQEASPYSVVLVDSDARFNGAVHSASRKTPERTVICGSASYAEKILGDPTRNIGAVFINPVMPPPGGMKLLSLTRRMRPVTPVYLLYRGTPPFSPSEISRLGINGMRTPEEALASFDSSIISELRTLKPQARALLTRERGYLGIPAGDFLTGAPCPFDVFVRLPSGKFLKIVEAKDVFNPKRALSYLEKGVTHFFVKSAQHHRCVAYCDVLAQYLLERPDASQEIKFSQAMAAGQTVIEQIRASGMDPAHMDYVRAFVSDAHSVIRNVDLKDQPFLTKLTQSFSAYEHAVSTTMIAGLLSLPLKIESAAAFRTVATSALLHDVGLYPMPAAVQSGDEQAMTEAERALYRSHPQAGAKLLFGLPGIDETILQAVAQHHERRDNRGFPRKSSSTDINRIAEIVGISSEFARILREARTQGQLDPYAKMREEVFDGYSFPVIDSFQTVFMRNQRATV